MVKGQHVAAHVTTIRRHHDKEKAPTHFQAHNIQHRNDMYLSGYGREK